RKQEPPSMLPADWQVPGSQPLTLITSTLSAYARQNDRLRLLGPDRHGVKGTRVLGKDPPNPSAGTGIGCLPRCAVWHSVRLFTYSCKNLQCDRKGEKQCLTGADRGPVPFR